MTIKEKINTAVIAIDKGMDFETLRYSDYMYGNEGYTDEVWEYVVEASEEGMKWFRKTYSKYLTN